MAGRHAAPRRRRSLRVPAAPVWSAVLAALGIVSLTAGFTVREQAPVTTVPAPPAIVAPRSETAAPPPPARAATAPAAPVAEPTRLRIPTIDVDAPVVELGLRDDGRLQVPPDGRQAGWYAQGPAPGEPGPAVIVAHIDWNHEPGVFARLARLRQGDRVFVDRADGTAATFEVGRLEQHPKDDFPTQAVYGPTHRAALRLITCGGEFDSDERNYRDNIIAYAHLVQG